MEMGNRNAEGNTPDLRTLFAAMTPEEIREASRVRELEEWRAVNRFCGRCGAAMRPHADPFERAFVCPACGYAAYPKISPAVIALVTKGDRILLQRNTHYKSVKWSLVAGFVDPGESFEEAVRREIAEEASIEVMNVRYFGSQTWPFPSNIMVGFTAEHAAGELCPDGDEVVASAWFDRDHLPEIPRKGSIARAMIDDWAAGRAESRYAKRKEETMKILVLNGPNLNLLGLREPALYGSRTYTELETFIRATAAAVGVTVEVFQSNHEGALVDRIQAAYGVFDAIVLNAAAYTHTSVAILDALKAVSIPVVEVHLTEPKAREDFRRVSYPGMVAARTFSGKGFESYAEAIRFIAEGGK